MPQQGHDVRARAAAPSAAAERICGRQSRLRDGSPPPTRRWPSLRPVPQTTSPAAADSERDKMKIGCRITKLPFDTHDTYDTCGD